MSATDFYGRLRDGLIVKVSLVFERESVLLKVKRSAPRGGAADSQRTC